MIDIFDSIDSKIITYGEAYVFSRKIRQTIKQHTCFLMFNSGRVVSFWDLSNQDHSWDIENQIIPVYTSHQARKVINDLKKSYSEAGLQVPGLSLIFCWTNIVSKKPVIRHEHRFVTQ